MLDDRTREDDEPVEGEEPAATPAFNPFYAVGGAVIAMIVGLMAVSGLLMPVLVLGGVFLVFLLTQVLIFKVFPPRKSDGAG